ncbi:hypothetical protein [Burkholderia ubonensis]|uniref:hypothetical protein n=1 Tax=Burkholderia ubonensis TaxID=101571 RepID=UPI000BA4E762|nr:hypothetical protein [Burkholderia ubonensis]PAK14396.1 hypothetical protein CJO66_11865 [Burkholderia ubonensis]RQP28591.1 hypothetical protein DF155_27310 [Burkholderia ubonensis]RQP31289.1 hypothetical protein DF154_29550 [Burkholderia ubonensis]RQP33446.1 hypothetical protein DF156_28145 [Burkholderia ubonensis]RQP48785.1 hypothetical protein DF144_27020 [Burkholderia ubonensis]
MRVEQQQAVQLDHVGPRADFEEVQRQFRIGEIQARVARYSDVVALLQALGGGWWNRADVR